MKGVMEGMKREVVEHAKEGGEGSDDKRNIRKEGVNEG